MGLLVVEKHQEPLAQRQEEVTHQELEALMPKVGAASKAALEAAAGTQRVLAVSPRTEEMAEQVLPVGLP